MLKIDGYPVPLDFIRRHRNPTKVEGYTEYNMCKCGAEFEAIGEREQLVLSPAFQLHIREAFERYKLKQRKLIGGNVSG